MKNPPQNAARTLLHEVNNFLTVCRTHGELALRVGDPNGTRRALEVLLERASSLEDCARGARRELLGQPEKSQVPPVRFDGT